MWIINAADLSYEDNSAETQDPFYLEPMKRFCRIGNEQIKEILEALDEVYPVAISVYFEEYLTELKLKISKYLETI